jgi:hypothetical protein
MERKLEKEKFRGKWSECVRMMEISVEILLDG